MRVAVVGMGRMGSAMAVRLAESGHEVVVFNRTRERAEQAAAASGAAVASTAAEAAARAEVVVSSLSDDRAVLDAYLGEGGVVEGLGEGTVTMETSTVDPETPRRLAEPVASRGASFLDTPVSGSVPAVQQGTLTLMVGGDAAALERARPVVDALGAKVFHLGPVGSGAVVKLAVNGIVHAINMALSEALVLAERAGVERARAYEVFASSAAAAPFVQYKRQAFESPEEAGVAFSLDLVAKDLELILGLARRVELPMGQAGENLAIAREAMAAGFADADMSAVARYLRDR